MKCAALSMVVPTAAEGLLICLCLLVWVKLRQLEVNGACQWTLLAITMDGLTQSWQLWLRPGQPAGVVWLLHVGLSYTMVYILYRLGKLLRRLRPEDETGGGEVVHSME